MKPSLALRGGNGRHRGATRGAGQVALLAYFANGSHGLDAGSNAPSRSLRDRLHHGRAVLEVDWVDPFREGFRHFARLF